MGGFIFYASLLICLFLDISTSAEDLAVVSHPEDVTAHIGQTVQLRCEFNQMYNCIWLRNGHPVVINERYAYIDQPKCTIEISKVEDIDFGEWKCGVAIIDGSYVYSNSAVLSKKIVLDVQVHYKDISDSVVKVELDNDRVLSCSSENKVATNYSWEYKDGDSNEWKRYSSSKIINLRNTTVSLFRCSAVANGRKIYSNEYMITFVNKESVNDVPRPILYIGIGFLAIVGFCTCAAGIFAVFYLCFNKYYKIIFKRRPRLFLGKPEENDNLLEAGSSQFDQTIYCPGEMKQIKKEFEKLVKSSKKMYEKDKDKMTTVFTWTINNYSEVKKQHERATSREEFIVSDAFDVKETDLKMTIKLYLFGYLRGYGSYITPVLEFVKNGTDRVAAPPFLHKRIIKLLDQREIPESEKHHIYFDFEAPFGSILTQEWMTIPWAKHRFARYSLVERNDSPFLKNNTIILQVIIEPLQLLWKNIKFYDGSLVWKITDYMRKKREEKEGLYQCLRSDDFYTGPYGYRCKVSLFLNGNGQGHRHHMSIYLEFLKGQWDDQLDNPFAYRVCYSIVNQTDPTKNFERVDTIDPKYMGEAEASLRLSDFYGIEKFAVIQDIESESNGYLLDDQIIVKVAIDLTTFSSSAGQVSKGKSLVKSNQTRDV